MVKGRSPAYGTSGFSAQRREGNRRHCRFLLTAKE
jgi:hypothetical protein